MTTADKVEILSPKFNANGDEILDGSEPAHLMVALARIDETLSYISADTERTTSALERIAIALERIADAK